MITVKAGYPPAKEPDKFYIWRFRSVMPIIQQDYVMNHEVLKHGK